jgi:hypothetical protein
MNYDSTDSRSIPPLQVDGDLICDSKERAKIFNVFFCNQSDLDDTNILTPNIFLKMGVTLAHFQLVGNIPVLRDKLKSLERGDFKIWVASFNKLGLTA